MKNMKLFVFILIIFSLTQQNISAQCIEYIDAVAEYDLEPYISDGNFLAKPIYEGETMTFERTFFAGEKYKIVALGMDLFEKYITVRDADGFIIFHNYMIRSIEPTTFTTQDGTSITAYGLNFWEFELETSQVLTIEVELEQIAKRKKTRLQGCMGIVIGFLPADIY